MAMKNGTTAKSKTPRKRVPKKVIEENVSEENTEVLDSSAEPQPRQEDSKVFICVKEMFLPVNPKTGLHLGVVNPNKFKKTNSGALHIPGDTQLDRHDFEPEMWKAWMASGKIAEQELVAILGTRQALKRVIQLVHDSKGTLTMESLKWQGGFNRRTNRNAGVHTGHHIGDEEG